MMRMLYFFCFMIFAVAAVGQQHSYCNPVNIDYGYTPIPNFSEWGRHRATADPVIVTFSPPATLPVDGLMSDTTGRPLVAAAAVHR